MSTKCHRKVKAVDLEKFKALVHYICDAFSTNPTSLGKVKLQKILWNLDRTAYLKSGSTISGVPYVKMPQGPATPLLDDAISELERDGKLKVRTVLNGSYRQNLFIALEEAGDEAFSKQDIRLIERWVREIAPKTAAQVSDESHDLTWDIYELGEEIDLVSTLLPALQPIDPNVLEKSMARFADAAQEDAK